MQKAILLTVDLEDWFQVENLRGCFPHAGWDDCQLRVEKSTRALLELFKKHDVKATFFVLGWIAKRCPSLIEEIDVQGHEIASHGFGHDLCTALSPDELSKDIQKGKEILEAITGKQVRGYRAPNFSITDSLILALEEIGFFYDSSYNDFSAHSRYGALPGSWAEVAPGLLKNKSGFYEIPVRNLPFFGKKVPWGGGGYFRLIPGWIFNRGVRRFLRENDTYLFYCHPWEFDPGQPKVRSLRFDYRFRHYINIGHNLSKLHVFLNCFSDCRFITCSQFIGI